MLVLTRRVGETVRIGEDVNVTILGIKGSHIRVGVAAPKEVTVHREEIYRRIQQEKIDKSEAVLREAGDTYGNK